MIGSLQCLRHIIATASEPHLAPNPRFSRGRIELSGRPPPPTIRPSVSSPPGRGSLPMSDFFDDVTNLRARLAALQAEHRDLDLAISQLYASPKIGRASCRERV